MIAASVLSGDPLDGGRQAAIALGDEVGELVDLFGRFGRRLDLDPTADALEDFGGVEGVGGCCCHWRIFVSRNNPPNVMRSRQRARVNRHGSAG